MTKLILTHECLIAQLFVQARLIASAAERDTELESRTQVPRLYSLRLEL